MRRAFLPDGRNQKNERVENDLAFCRDDSAKSCFTLSMLSASGAPESWFERLKELFKYPRTSWEKIARAAWVFVILYFLATAVTAVARWTWPPWLRPPIDTGFGVALVIVSIWGGGIFTDFYSKLT